MTFTCFHKNDEKGYTCLKRAYFRCTSCSDMLDKEGCADKVHLCTLCCIDYNDAMIGSVVSDQDMPDRCHQNSWHLNSPIHITQSQHLQYTKGSRVYEKVAVIRKTKTVTATATVNKDKDSDNSLLELQSSTKPFHSKRPTSVLASTHLTSHERPSLSQMSSTPSLKRPREPDSHNSDTSSTPSPKRSREPDSHNSDTSLSLPSLSQFSSSLVPSPLGTSPLEPSPMSSLLRQHILLTPDGSFSPDKVPTEVPRDPFLDSTDYPPIYKDDDEDVDSDDSI